MRLLALVGAVGACGFSPRAIDVGANNPDGHVDDASAIDAATVARIIYASSDQMLYEVDIDQHVARMVGSMGMSMNGLAYRNGKLIGIPAAGDSLVTIDPATGQVIATVTLSAIHTYYALTVAANGTIFSATPNATGVNLYTIAPNGIVTANGTFGGNRYVAGDLAFVNGTLYVTLEGGNCNPQCIATVDPIAGTAIPFIINGPGDMWALSGYNNTLWVLHGNGDVDRVDTSQNQLQHVFNAGAIDWWEAAQ